MGVQVNGDESDVCVKALMEKMRQVQEAPAGILSAEERIKQFNMEGKSTAESKACILIHFQKKFNFVMNMIA